MPLLRTSTRSRGTDTDGHTYAPLWRRLVAAIVDGLVLIIPIAIARAIFRQTSLGAVVALTYFVTYTALTGRTVGKRATGIEVRHADGSRMDFPSAALREVLGKFLSGLLAGLGYLWAVWDERSQALHDKIAGTVVVMSDRPERKKAPEQLREPREAWTVAESDLRNVIRTTVDRAVQTGTGRVVAAVQGDKPNPSRGAQGEGTLTILFADIEDAAELTDVLGDEVSRDALRTFERIVRDEVKAAEGHVVKATGDGAMATFRSSVRGVKCALAIRDRVRRADHVPPLRASIGMHVGEVVRDHGDLYGLGVVLAARIASEARGGEVLVSSVLKELAGVSGDFQFSEPRTTVLKDLSGPHRLYAVLG